MHLKLTPIICSVLAPLKVTLIAIGFDVSSAPVKLYCPPDEIPPPI